MFHMTLVQRWWNFPCKSAICF